MSKEEEKKHIDIRDRTRYYITRYFDEYGLPVERFEDAKSFFIVGVDENGEPTIYICNPGIGRDAQRKKKRGNVENVYGFEVSDEDVARMILRLASVMGCVERKK